MTEDLSRPERCTARAEARQIREAVREAGGCTYCLHRFKGLEGLRGTRGACGLTPGLQFPACADHDDKAPGFEFDEQAFARRST